MVGNIIGEPIKPIIGEQVDLRQKVHGAGLTGESVERTPEVLNYLNNRNAWIKMASGVSILKGEGEERLKALAKNETSGYLTNNDIESLIGINLAKKYVLFNTLQELTKGAVTTTTGEGNDAVLTQTSTAIYNTRSGTRNSNSWGDSQGKMYGGLGGNSRGLQPVPGITSINVEAINRGSIRKATVNLKAYNKFQFGIIEILYLRLGFLMMLEWGWDKYIDSIDENNKPVFKNTESTIIENGWFKENNLTQSEMLININSYVDRYKGNYQGFFGKVNNFSWNLNQDNTYDITINLITVGSVIESINTLVPTKPLTQKQINERTKKLREIYQIKTDDEGELQEGQEDNSVITNLGSDRISAFLAQQISTFFTQKLQVNKNYYFFPNAAGQAKKNNGELVKDADVNINRAKIPPSSNYYIRFGKFLEIVQDNVIFKVDNGGNGLSESQIEFDNLTNDTRINYEPNLIPLDPSICLFKPVFTDELGLTETINLPTFKSLKDFVVEKNNVYYGKLLNVYLNMDYISNVLNTNKNEKNELNLYDFLQKLLDGISRCMGNVPELVVSIKNDRTIYFLDENPITGYDLAYPSKNKNFKFNILGYDSENNSSNFVKSFNFQTKITPKLMTQISIGATAAGGDQNAQNAVGYKQWMGRGLKNRFEEKYGSGPNFKYIGSEDVVEDDPDTAYYNDIYDNQFSVEASFRPLPSSYSWTYKGYTKKYGAPSTSFWSSRKTNLEQDDLRAIVIQGIKDIDKAIADKGIEVAADGEKLNDYPTYLLDAFGGTGTKFIEVDVSRAEREKKQRQIRKENRENGTSNSVNEGEGLITKLVPQRVSTKNALYWYSSDNQDFINRAYNVFKQYKSFLDQYMFETEDVSSSTTGFIPVTLSLGFDGLGGIKIYNQIAVNQKALPASYPESLKFVIDGVSHEVSDNKWTTELSTISQPVVKKTIRRKMSKIRENATTPDKVLSTDVSQYTEQQKKSLVLGISLIAKNGSKNGLIYSTEKTPKIQITLHHTAALSTIQSTIESWRSGTDRVSTHFIIRRNGQYDQLFPLENWGNHIGSSRPGNSYLQTRTISFELEAAGYLTHIAGSGGKKAKTVRIDGINQIEYSFTDNAKFKQDGKTFTYKELKQGLDYRAVSQPVKMNKNNKIKYTRDYRGYQFYHSYTTPQLNKLKELLQKIKNEYPNIPIGCQFSGINAFSEQFPKNKNVSSTAWNKNPGIYTHNSYRTDKRDVFPQRELINILKEFNS